jgi:hypothetical protein
MNGFAARCMMDRPLPIRMLDITKPGKESSEELGQKEREAMVKTPRPVRKVALKPTRVKMG